MKHLLFHEILPTTTTATIMGETQNQVDDSSGDQQQHQQQQQKPAAPAQGKDNAAAGVSLNAKLVLLIYNSITSGKRIIIMIIVK